MPNRMQTPSTQARTAASPRLGAGLSESEIQEIATDAYLYAYPLVLMEITRRVTTNVEAPRGAHAPMNQFAHLPAFPDASFTDVVRPNADTLYSSLWMDLGHEPLVITVPDSGGRYFLLPMLDMWTDIFASPGKRTSGTAAQTLVVTGPEWSGTLPDGVTAIRSPTACVWMLGRTQTNGKADYDAVHAFQAGLRAFPLSAWGKDYTPPKAKVDPRLDMSAPPDQVARMDAETFFRTFLALTASNPPHADDQPILARMARIGLRPFAQLDPGALPPPIERALNGAAEAAKPLILNTVAQESRLVNGWMMAANPIGTYGTDFAKRAGVAWFGLGANVIEDACYPTMDSHSLGRPLDSGTPAVLHFDKAQIPPARAFWSLTLYDERQLFTANPIDRYAIGDRDQLKFNPDGSLDLWLQRDNPGAARESNWLPTPARGTYSLTMRLYWPGRAATDGSWSPPPLRSVQ